MNFATSTLRTELGRLIVLVTILVLPFALAACDQQVEEETFGQITPENFFNNEQEFVSAAAAAYEPLRNMIFAPFDMSEHSSDETMVPTRGPDWGDGGIWRDMTQHTWKASHPFPNGAWGLFNTGISRTNSVLTSVGRSDAVSEARKQEFAAEMRFLRAYYYYWLMDLFGAVPIVVENGSDLDFPQQPVSDDDPPPQNTRKEVYDFILEELTGCASDNFNEGCVTSPDGGAVLANLRPKGEVDYGRATRGAGYAFLARLLINSEVYGVSVGAGQGSASDIGNGPDLYAQAAAAADEVINSGRYALADDYYRNFAVDNQNTDEIIFAATFKAKAPFSGFTKMMSVWHYNHPAVSATPWNGFTTIAEFYNSFDNVPNNEVRQDQFLVGPQYQEPNESCFGDECFSDASSDPVTVRGSETQLDITVDIPDIRLEGDAEDLEAPGARPHKFEIDPNAEQFNMGNDFPLFRLTEMYLIKAEAENEVNGPDAAKPWLNDIRARSDADEVTGTPSIQEMHELILQERGFEFHFEILRRQDLIRYEFAHDGMDIDDPYAPTFTGPWLFKEASSEHRALFPIPEQQLSVNPKLSQNPGY